MHARIVGACNPMRSVLRKSQSRFWPTVQTLTATYLKSTGNVCICACVRAPALFYSATDNPLEIHRPWQTCIAHTLSWW